MANSLTQETFLQLLPAIGFTKHGHTWSKSIHGAIMAVDTAKEQLIYPEDPGLIINERQTCNFSSPENFVVFECVHRLLEKGYHAKNIELEPKWKVGHGASGGRADILIKDNKGNALLIIECKTWGREFDKAWKATLNDGDQLFSYAQQISEVQFLCLYASTVEEDGTLTYRSHVIAHRDNDKYLEENKLKGFAKATDVQSRYAIWRETYKQDYTTTGIFEPNVQPYKIGEAKLTATDLRPISDSDRQGQYHEFATILRQHNVSGRENAFDKLVNLFLCKLVDEMRNPNDLRFYWRGVAYDTHFDLLDRLQQLYSQGMKEFLKEDITYINEADVKKALRLIKSKPDATQRSVWRLFRRQKFFTNNDFSFIEVHNEKLFFQNAEVLLKVLQMWQDIRLVDDSGHNQFLGDMFEGFLDQGVKQSEGQFFTPMPICRFLMMSLPLESIVKGRNTPPRAIDYACGAGHFLTELALQLKPLVAQHRPKAHLDEYHAAIFGIEKEYRLSKIAKVSAYMYGQPGIRICYGDALMHEHPNFADIQNGSFDLLVANPPFSVTGFLETLPEAERNRYRLTNTINDLDTANSIETFFIERAAQLLAPGGIAAIILPASILSNGGSAYVTAREVLIQSFDIVAIAELGSGTFGKTGTNTVTLFLRRKANDPDPAEHYRERIAEWFSGPQNDKRKAAVYRDAHLITAYAAHIGSTDADYKTLLCGQPNAAVLGHDTFKAYRKTFDDSTEVKNLHKARWFKALSKTEQDAEITKRFVTHISVIEQDKLLHFILAHEQPNQVLILRSPTDTKEQKRFLGYDWSAAKGNEGIKLIKDANGKHLTPLYDETNRANAAKINHAIARNFDGKLDAVPAELEPYLLLSPLVDLLDFSRVGFEKQVGLVSQKKDRVQIATKWPLVCLRDIAQIVNGGTPDTDNTEFWDGGDVCWATLKDTKVKYLRDTERKITKAGLRHTNLLPTNSVIFSSRATIGEVCINLVPTATNQGYKSFVCEPTKVATLYLYHLLVHLRPVFENLVPAGSKYKEINGSTIAEFKVPLPPLPTQQTIVTECEAVDKETEAAQASITAAKAEIERIVQGIYASNAPRREIDAVSLNVQYGLSEKMNEGGVGYRIFRMNEIVNGRMHDNGSMKHADITPEEFATLKLNRGDVLFNRTNSIEHVGKTGLFDLEGDYCFASYLVRIVPDQKQVLPLFLTQMMNATEFQTEAKSKASKSINQANINATIMRNMAVPVPPLPQQAKVVQAIEAEEAKITAAEAIITAAPAKKEAILKKHLQ